jgi:hypothetical protein
MDFVSNEYKRPTRLLKGPEKLGDLVWENRSANTHTGRTVIIDLSLYEFDHQIEDRAIEPSVCK